MIHKLKQVIVRILYPAARLYWFIFRPKTAGSKCIIVSDGEILLLKNSYGSGVWTLPGGGIKKGETPEMAAMRETKEETGIQLAGLEYLGVTENNLEYKRDSVHFFFGATLTKSTVPETFEISDAEWFPIRNLPSPLSFLARQGIELARKKQLL